MIANSHQPDNVFDVCLDELVDAIQKSISNATVVIRPHPQYVRRFPAKMQAIEAKYAGRTGIVLETDFSKPSTMDQSDVLITDWSGIAYEFAYKTRRPTLFINTPMKVVNPEWKRVGITPTDIWFRDEVGVSLELADVAAKAGETVVDMLGRPDAFAAKIGGLFRENFFNPGHAGGAVGSYILDTLIEKENSR